MPFSVPAGSGGVSTSTVPIFEPAGQATGLRVPLPNSASVQDCRPLAADGFSPIPSGSVTSALRRWDSLCVSPPVMNGSVVSIVGVAGESTWVVPGATLSPGSNGTVAQPVCVRPSGRDRSDANGVALAGKSGSSLPGGNTGWARRNVV